MSESYLQPNGDGLANIYYKFLGPELTPILEQNADIVSHELSLATYFVDPQCASRKAGTSTTFVLLRQQINDSESERLGLLLSLMDEPPSDLDPSNPAIELLDVDGDGCCMLYAISTALIGDQSLWHYLRSALHGLMMDSAAIEKVQKSLPTPGEFLKDQWRDLLLRTSDALDEPTLSYDSSPAFERSLEGFHMYLLSVILKRPILLLHDGAVGLTSRAFLPFLVPAEEWGPALLYAYTNESLNHFTAVVPTRSSGAQIPLSLLATPRGTLHVCGSCLMENYEMDISRVQEFLGGKDHFLVKPFEPLTVRQQQKEMLLSVGKSFAPEAVMEAMSAITLHNPLRAATLLGKPLKSYLEIALRSMNHCLRCSACVVPIRVGIVQRRCNECKGTQLTHLENEEIIPWQRVRMDCKRFAIHVQQGARQVCMTWVEGISRPHQIAALVRTVASPDVAQDATIVYITQGESFFLSATGDRKACPVSLDDGQEIVKAVEDAVESAKKGVVVNEPMSSTRYLWVSLDPHSHDGSWVPYEDQESLEAAYQSKVTSHVMIIWGRRFVMDFTIWRQVNDIGGTRAVRRIPDEWECVHCTMKNACNLFCLGCRKPLKLTPENDPYLRKGGYYYNKVSRKPHQTYVLSAYQSYDLFHYEPTTDCLMSGPATAWECVACGHGNALSNDERCSQCKVGTGDPMTDARLAVGGILFKTAGLSPQKCLACKMNGNTTTPCYAVHYLFPKAYTSMRFAFKSSSMTLVPQSVVLTAAECAPGGYIYEHIKAKSHGVLENNRVYTEADLPAESVPNNVKVRLVYRKAMDQLMSLHVADDDDDDDESYF
jgi:hypothetical protein